MDLQMVLAVILSGAIGVSLGLFGGGGSILAVPVLVYVAGLDAGKAVFMSLAIVGATSAFATVLNRRKAALDLHMARRDGADAIRLGRTVGADRRLFGECSRRRAEQ